MDLFDPFFTAEPDNNTSLAPLTPTNPTQSAQQDLLHIFGDGGGGGDFCSPPPAFSCPSSSSTQVCGSMMTEEESSPNSAFGGERDDQEFFDLVDMTTGQNTGDFRTSANENPDPFGMDPFATDAWQKTHQESLSPKQSESSDPWGSMTQETRSGFQSRTPFDDSMDMFFGGASQLAGPHDAKCVTFSKNFDDLLFIDEDPDPDPGAKGAKVCMEPVAGLVSDKVDQVQVHTVDKQSPDSLLPSSQDCQESAVACLETDLSKNGHSNDQKMTNTIFSNVCALGRSVQATGGAENVDGHQAAPKSHSPVQTATTNSGTLMFYEKTITVQQETPMTDKDCSPQIKDSDEDSVSFIEIYGVQQSTEAIYSNDGEPSECKVDSESTTAIFQDDSRMECMSPESSSQLKKSATVFETTSSHPENGVTLETIPRNLLKNSDQSMGEMARDLGRSDDDDIPWMDSPPTEAVEVTVVEQMAYIGQNTSGQFVTVVEAACSPQNVKDVLESKTLESGITLQDKGDYIQSTQDGELGHGRHELQKEYGRQPEVQEEYVRQHELQKEYYRQPEVQEEYGRQHELQKEYYRQPEVQEEYYRQPEGQEEYGRRNEVQEECGREQKGQEGNRKQPEAEEKDDTWSKDNEKYERQPAEHEYVRQLKGEDGYGREQEEEYGIEQEEEYGREQEEEYGREQEEEYGREQEEEYGRQLKGEERYGREQEEEYGRQLKGEERYGREQEEGYAREQEEGYAREQVEGYAREQEEGYAREQEEGYAREQEEEYGRQLKGEDEKCRQREEDGEDDRTETLALADKEEYGDESNMASPSPSSSSQHAKPLSQAESQDHSLGHTRYTTLAAAAVEGETTKTGIGESVDFMMNAKKEIHGRLDLTGNLDGFTTSTTATTSNRNCAQTACIDNNNNDDDDASDDLRLDDFIGISETESNDLSEGLFKGSVKSSSSVRRSKKLVRRRKSAADVSSPPSPLSPVIVVDVVDGRKDEEDEGEEVEGVTLKDAGNEKGVEEEEGGEGDEDVEEELKKKNSSDADMDFGVLEAVSSHLNVEMSKQKTSLRKRGSLARRKRPTRHTVTLPTGASDNADETPRTTFSSQMDISDDVNSGKQSILDSSGDAADTPKKFLPRKPPMMIPGLEDLKQSKLFKQECQNRDNQSSPIISATATTTTTTTTKKSPQFPNVGQRRGSDDQAPESTAETGTGRSNSMYKMPLWLTEMKAKTIAKTQPALLSSETVSDTQSKRNEDLNAANLDLLQTGYGSSIAPRSAMSTMDASTAKKGDGLWLKNRGLSPAGAGAGSKENKQEKELDRPAWMRTALQKTSRVVDSLQGQKDNQDNRQNEDGDDASTVPPWAAELKRKNRPLVGVGHAATGINRSEKAETPSKKSTETRERDTYMPSWANRNQPNSPNTSSPQNKATNGSPADVKGAKGIPTHTGEIPSWKLELAERRKRRQSLQEGAEAGGSSNSRDDVTDSPSNSLTALRQQLKPRKSSIPTSERSSGEGGSNPNPDWTKTVEERRARLLKSGLLGQASEESHC